MQLEADVRVVAASGAARGITADLDVGETRGEGPHAILLPTFPRRIALEVRHRHAKRDAIAEEPSQRAKVEADVLREGLDLEGACARVAAGADEREESEVGQQPGILVALRAKHTLACSEPHRGGGASVLPEQLASPCCGLEGEHVGGVGDDLRVPARRDGAVLADRGYRGARTEWTYGGELQRDELVG